MPRLPVPQRTAQPVRPSYQHPVVRLTPQGAVAVEQPRALRLRQPASLRPEAQNPFTLTFDQFKAVILPTRYMDDKGKERFCLHIDRKVSTRGYEAGNIQVLTCTENVQKENAERRQRFVDEKIHGRAVEDDESDPF
jgi:hypothetical protein